MRADFNDNGSNRNSLIHRYPLSLIVLKIRQQLGTPMKERVACILGRKIYFTYRSDHKINVMICEFRANRLQEASSLKRGPLRYVIGVVERL